MRLWTSLLALVLATASLAAQAEVPLYLMTMPPLVIDREGRRGMVGDVVLDAALASIRADGTTRKLMKRYAAEPGFALD